MRPTNWVRCKLGSFCSSYKSQTTEPGLAVIEPVPCQDIFHKFF